MDLNNSTTPESEQDLAQTPQWFIKAVQVLGKFTFALDVCALRQTAKCAAYYSLEEGRNSLVLPWASHNFCNPPYSDIMPWINKAHIEAEKGNITYLLIPDKPEVGYIRHCRTFADTVIHMPFRLNFLRPDGSKFLDKNGKPQGPKFPVMLVLITPWGIDVPVRDIYVDFRDYGI